MTDTLRPLYEKFMRQDLMVFHAWAFKQLVPNRPFLPNWHLDAIAWKLQDVMAGRCKRLIINLPPRMGKSLLTSVSFPAFLHGRDPTLKIITASYGADLAAKHANDTRYLMGMKDYKRLFTTRLSPTKDTEREYMTTARGSRLVTSVGGRLTGLGGAILIIDDPQKAEEALSEVARKNANEWLLGTSLSRLDNSDDAIIIVSQRLHLEDMSGFALERGGWELLSIPAIAPCDMVVQTGPAEYHHRKEGEVIDPRRYSQEYVLSQRQQLGDFFFSAQYGQEPIPVTGGIVRWEEFMRYDKLPSRVDRFVHSWDLASKASEFSAYSVGTVWAVIGGDHYLIDLFRAKLDFPDMYKAVIQLAQRWPASEIMIEEAAAGLHLIPWLRLEGPCRMPMPTAIRPEGDKVTRLHAASAVVRDGRVYLPTEAPWLDDLRAELAQFPYGKYSDQVDSISQYLKRAEARRLRGPGIQRRSMF